MYDEAMRIAVRQFQHKNMIYEANFLRRKTVDALARRRSTTTTTGSCARCASA